VENMKVPIALVIAMAVQLAGGVWWVSQQAATIANLEETVSQLGSKMAIEDNVNLKRDVQDNAMEIDYLWDEVDEVWEEHEQLASTIKAITTLQQRVALLENDLKYINRDHEGVLDKKGSMK
jgi:predicted RNase H-like nuclease (RuvC/YqgF family)